MTRKDYVKLTDALAGFVPSDPAAENLRLAQRRVASKGVKLAGLDALRERLLSPEGFAAFMNSGKAR